MRSASWAILVALPLLTTALPARADLDIANLYLRKIKLGEKTFLREDGWSLARNRIDLFYELDYVSDVYPRGASGLEPSALFRSVQPGASWAGAFSAGALIRTTPARSFVEATAFALVSQVMPIEVDGDTMKLLASTGGGLLALFVPPAFTRPDGVAFKQGMTGGQVRFGSWAAATYGLVMDERGGLSRYNHFYELGVPLFFKGQLLSAGPPFDRVERVNALFTLPGVLLSPLLPEELHFDELTFGYSFLAPSPSVVERKFFFVRGDRLFRYLSFELKLTQRGDLASAYGGLQLGTTGAGDARRNGKFGTAFDAKLYVTAVDPRYASPWGVAEGTTEGLLTGVRGELYFQIPMAWFMAGVMAIGASGAKSEEDRQRAAEAAEALAELGDEDDSLYAGVTIGMGYQDPWTMNDVPNAEGSFRFYMNTRFFY